MVAEAINSPACTSLYQGTLQMLRGVAASPRGLRAGAPLRAARRLAFLSPPALPAAV